MPSKRTPVLAKLSPPRLLHSVPRERLFAWLDGQRPRAGIWLEGQPGAGKTTLAAAWLRARTLPFLWYRADADDNDIGRFFAMLAEAAGTVGPRLRLPRFAPEHLADPRAYARPWFRALFAALPRPVVLVFDNLEQAELPALPQLLATALTEAPAGVTLLMTSRHRPPPELAGAGVADLLAILPSAELNFTPEELSLYASAFELDIARVEAAARRVGGWAAGVRLLSVDAAATEPLAPPRVLSDYFAGLLHEGMDERSRHLLLVGALLPWMPATLLAQLSEVADAVERLDALCAKNLFTERVGEGARLYRLHPMFRDVLLERGRLTFSADVRAALLRRAATGFAELGALDAAIDLAFDAGDDQRAATWWLSVFETKLALGQLDQLNAWFDRVPPPLLQARPQLLYARARLCFLREDTAALTHYQAACAGFAAVGDLRGQQLCAAGVLEWSYNTDSFADHRRWCELIDRPPLESEVELVEVERLRLLNGRLLAAFFGGTFASRGAAWMAQVAAVLVPGPWTNERLSVAVTLLGCLERSKRWDDARLLAGRMESMLDAPDLGPRLKILVRQQIASDLHRQTGQFDEARRLALGALDEASRHGFAVLAFEAIAILLLSAQYTGDDQEAARLLEELSTRTRSDNVYHLRFSHQMRAWHELQRGRLGPAREHASALRAAVEHSDMPASFRATWLLIAAYADFAAGRRREACDELNGFIAQAEPGSRDTLRVNALSLRAWCHLQGHRPDDAARDLSEAWSVADGLSYFQMLAPLRSTLSELAGFALERTISPTFTRELIRRRRLVAASPLATEWPWRLRLTTLGRFAVAVDGEALVFSGKVPKKPLALLKALVAFGGDAVALHRLADALWPDEDADAAHAALNVALHRLRKLLGRGAEALVLQEGCLTLHAQHCWTDARAFERMAASADLRGRALSLYRGHFLAEEGDAAWSISTRERLRGRFTDSLLAHAAMLAQAGRLEEALACYRHGLEIDDLDEQFYQGVMRCTLALGRPSEGLAAYQRLKRMLSTLLDVAPSSTSEGLHRQLRA